MNVAERSMGSTGSRGSLVVRPPCRRRRVANLRGRRSWCDDEVMKFGGETGALRCGAHNSNESLLGRWHVQMSAELPRDARRILKWPKVGGNSVIIQFETSKVTTVENLGSPSSSSTPVLNHWSSLMRTMTPAWSYWATNVPLTSTVTSKSPETLSPKRCPLSRRASTLSPVTRQKSVDGSVVTERSLPFHVQRAGSLIHSTAISSPVVVDACSNHARARNTSSRHANSSESNVNDGGVMGRLVKGSE